MKNIYFFILLIAFISVFTSYTFGQVNISGQVTGDNNEVLPYVNIGIPEKNVGTTSDKNGSFSLNIPTQNETDSIRFSLPGYQEKTFPIKQFSLKDKLTIVLNKNPVVSMTGSSNNKLAERRFGKKKEKAIIRFTEATVIENDIFEIAQLVELDSIYTQISSVNVFINAARKDSVSLRIKFYEPGENGPGRSLIDKNILLRLPVTEGWERIDISSYGVFLKGKVIVAIEFLSDKKTNTPIYYGVRPGGGAKSYLRTSSQGKWTIPIYTFRLYVTALVPENELQEDESETEFTPTARLYSEAVKDSFSIFIRLPKGYSKEGNRTYPVVYVLDANLYYSILAEHLRNSSQVILLGIGYRDFEEMDSLRDRDYTFPAALAEDSFNVSGGADKFLSFIEKVLIPYTNKNYNVDTNSMTLMGHSLGGYFTLYTLKTELENKTHYFKNFVAASPSLHYYDRYLIKQFNTIIPADTLERTLSITVGAKEDEEDNENTTVNVDNFNSFVSLIRKKYKSIYLQSVIFPSFRHLETAVPTFIQFLNGYKE